MEFSVSSCLSFDLSFGTWFVEAKISQKRPLFLILALFTVILYQKSTAKRPNRGPDPDSSMSIAPTKTLWPEMKRNLEATQIVSNETKGNRKSKPKLAKRIGKRRYFRKTKPK